MRSILSRCQLLHVFLFVVAFVFLACRSVGRLDGAILSGSVSFDSASDLYTYGYNIANGNEIASSGLSYKIVELSVLVNSTSFANVPAPAAHTDAGWSFSSPMTTASDIGEVGMSWSWSGFSLGVPPFENGVPANITKSDFSFTTDRAPSSGTGNNYFLYALTDNGGVFADAKIIEFGRVVAPDFLIPAPEPSTLLLLTAGIISLLLARRHV
jgi:hypothetical protein